MAGGEIAPVSRQQFSVAYDGIRRSENHSIEVSTLAPALTAFGRLLREANAEFNGKNSIAEVRVVSDFEHKCFNINFQLIVGLYEQVKDLLQADEIKTAKDVLEWVGLIFHPVAAGASVAAGQLSFIEYLKWRKGRNISEKKNDSDPTGSILVSIIGDGNSVSIPMLVSRLAKNPKALRAAQDAFLPLGQDGFDTMRVASSESIESIIFNSDEVNDIAASCVKGIEESKEISRPDVEEIPAWLSVYSPVYDAAAKNWRFRFGRETIYADITETKIAEDALARGGAFSDDAYQVMLEVTTNYDSQGKSKQPIYKIKRLVKFVPAQRFDQSDLFNPKSI